MISPFLSLLTIFLLMLQIIILVQMVNSLDILIELKCNENCHKLLSKRLLPQIIIQFSLCICPSFLLLNNLNSCNCRTNLFGLSKNQKSLLLIFKESFFLKDNFSLNFTYIRLANFENNWPLTYPEYYQINSFNGNISLNITKNIIKIPYLIQINHSLNKRSVIITKIRKWNYWRNEWKPKKATGLKIYSNKNKKIFGKAMASPLAILPPIGLSLCRMITKMGWDSNQIRRFIMEDAAIKRIHPQQFDISHFKRAIIESHNRYRKLHGTNDLFHDGACEIAAKRWADSVSRQFSCLTHETQQRFGESLFFYSTLLPLLSDPETMAEATVRTFYIEGRDYKRSARWVASRHGHFTQMLWRDTNKIGIGLSIISQPAGWGCMPPGRGQAWIFYVVLRYDPPGNRLISERSFVDNVLPIENNNNNNIQDIQCLAI